MSRPQKEPASVMPATPPTRRQAGARRVLLGVAVAMPLALLLLGSSTSMFVGTAGAWANPCLRQRQVLENQLVTLRTELKRVESKGKALAATLVFVQDRTDQVVTHRGLLEDAIAAVEADLTRTNLTPAEKAADERKLKRWTRELAAVKARQAALEEQEDTLEEEIETLREEKDALEIHIAAVEGELAALEC